MLAAPRIPELAQRDRFVRRAVKDHAIFTLADEERACVPSQRRPGRTVQLFWSSSKEARRWAEALTGEGKLQDFSLQAFAAEILPGLISGKGLVGTDWVSDPIEAEVEPADLLLRLRAEAMPHFVQALREGGQVFLVAGVGSNGPLVSTLTKRGQELSGVHIYAQRSEAEWAMKKSGGKKVIADPIADFVSSTLPWAESKGHLILAEPIRAAGPFEITPADLATRLATATAAA
jgi:hypothetical protein